MEGTTPALIEEEAGRLGCILSPTQVDALSRYIALLVRWGARLNLTSRGECQPRPLVQRHLVDALAASRLLGPVRGRAADVGSGGGLPGVPLACLQPEMHMLLIESNSRKCSFLRTVGAALDLDAEVCCGRLETLALPPLELVCSRATWPPAQWVPRSLKLLVPGGRAVAFAARREGLPGIPDSELAYQLVDGTPRVVACYLNRRGQTVMG
jgi:16S rRNA (guanine527-N7)-methyltransferase